MARDSFSKIGFILAAAGSAVGVGNIWKFPYVVGEHGGGTFIIIYLLCSICLGVPVLIMEFGIGKGKDPSKGIVNAYARNSIFNFVKLAPIVGGLSSLFIISFYCVIIGWIFKYFFLAVMGDLPTTTAMAREMFTKTSDSDAGIGLLLFFLAVFINYQIVKRGLSQGIEKISVAFMLGLFAIIIILFFYVLITFDGSSKAISYMFTFDWSKVNLETIQTASSHAFFSLSIGAGVMVAYSLGMHPVQKLVSTAFYIALIDILVAIFAGVIVFSFIFEYNGEISEGPGLIFVVLPSIFNSMGSIGYTISIAFFTLFIFAAITSSISLLEASSSMLQVLNMSKIRALRIMTTLTTILGSLALLSMNKEMGDILYIYGMTFFDFLDFLADQVGIELATLIGSIMVGWFMPKEYLKIRFAGYITPDVFNLWHFIIKYIVPVYITILIVAAFE